MLVIFTACTILAGDCREIVMPLADEPATPFLCLRAGQLVMAEWQREHGAWRVEGGMRCTPPSRLARSI